MKTANTAVINASTNYKGLQLGEVPATLFMSAEAIAEAIYKKAGILPRCCYLLVLSTNETASFGVNIGNELDLKSLVSRVTMKSILLSDFAQLY